MLKNSNTFFNMTSPMMFLNIKDCCETLFETYFCDICNCIKTIIAFDRIILLQAILFGNNRFSSAKTFFTYYIFKKIH